MCDIGVGDTLWSLGNGTCGEREAPEEHEAERAELCLPKRNHRIPESVRLENLSNTIESNLSPIPT